MKLYRKNSNHRPRISTPSKINRQSVNPLPYSVLTYTMKTLQLLKIIKNKNKRVTASYRIITVFQYAHNGIEEIYYVIAEPMQLGLFQFELNYSFDAPCV